MAKKETLKESTNEYIEKWMITSATTGRQSGYNSVRIEKNKSNIDELGRVESAQREEEPLVIRKGLGHEVVFSDGTAYNIGISNPGAAIDIAKKQKVADSRRRMRSAAFYTNNSGSYTGYYELSNGYGIKPKAPSIDKSVEKMRSAAGEREFRDIDPTRRMSEEEMRFLDEIKNI